MNSTDSSSRPLNTHFVPATGLACFLSWYDPLVRWSTGEAKFKAHLLEQLIATPNAYILDAGCGTGTLALAIAGKRPENCVIGLDADARILSQAARKERDARVTWQLGNTTRLPFVAETFDQVFCSLVFHHLRPTEKTQTLVEFLRVLKPQGVLCLADFGQPATLLAALRFLPVRLLDGWQRTECNVRGKLPLLMRSAGFSNVHPTFESSSLLGTVCCFYAVKSN